MMRILVGCLLGLVVLVSQAAAQSGPLRIEITEGVIEPMPFAVPGFVPDDPAATTETRLEARRALEAVMELPPERRQAVVLRFVNELSAREIGEIMGKSEGAVRVLIHRALVSVRQRLEP